MDLLSETLQIIDNGPIYRETKDLSLLIVEPWNAWSSLTFLVPALIFLWQLRGHYSEYKFIIWFCCPLLVLGGLGSTFFHAFRASYLLLLMDALPIIVLVLGISIWMWLKVLPQKIYLVWILLIFGGLTILSGFFLEGQDRISASYFFRGWMLLLPCYLFLRRTAFQNATKFLVALLFFVLALLFRFLDEKLYVSFMPWGTHWLWHVSTAFGAYFLGDYLIKNAVLKTEIIKKK
ncbi:ceramidase domain-containing protein [Fluviicola taffensis]|uniref:Membrane protein n=1 Tax=Fluviicola taffensis (strain DSM 16823 / NCIMB 13979 / RW262) TaxID=755732 RepID=F2ICI4_FLUTR|nr:ceramidase domain-containing protein [Fluviicola taffensis]AEA45454.1 membrane protein [Fluviicola taffensis DSM 16823]